MKHIFTLCFLLLFFCLQSKGQTTTFTSSGSYTIPAGITYLIVECWGGGGAGGGVTSKNSSAGGGAGGAYVKGVLSVTPGATYNYTVGAGGTGTTGDGNAGGSSWFGSPTSIMAVGGTGGKGVSNGTQNVPGVGLGGVAPTSGNVGGSVNYYGGSGGNGSGTTKTSGGGGGSAGYSSNGNAANGSTPGSAVNGGGREVLVSVATTWLVV